MSIMVASVICWAASLSIFSLCLRDAVSAAPDSPLLLPVPVGRDESELYRMDSCRDPGADETIEEGPDADEDDEDEDDQRLLLSLRAESTKWISPVITFIGLARRGYMTCPPVYAVDVSGVGILGAGDARGDDIVVIGVLVVTSPALCDGNVCGCSSLIIGGEKTKNKRECVLRCCVVLLSVVVLCGFFLFLFVWSSILFSFSLFKL